MNSLLKNMRFLNTCIGLAIMLALGLVFGSNPVSTSAERTNTVESVA